MSGAASAFADRLRRDRSELAASLTRETIRRNPDLLTRFPETGRVRTEEDFGYVLEYLAVALDLGAERPFVEFARWTAGVLAARGIAAPGFSGALDRVRAHLRSVYGGDLPATATATLEAAAREVLLPGETGPEDAGESPLADSRGAFLLAILDGDRAAALTVVREALAAGTGVRDVYVDVVGGALEEVGRLWERNRIDVAGEHLATAVAQSVLAHLYPELPPVAKTRGRVVVTGVEAELHQIGANVVADLLESDGFDVRFLGTNAPPAAVAGTVEEWKADVLGVSVTMLHHLPRLRELVETVRRRAGPRVPIVLGGGAVRRWPALAANVGADAAVTDLDDLFPVFRRQVAPR